ncbi:MAG TPA: class I SAM-dependent rRNA methyltransferase [Dissulfurispiraceae bacterium]|nr:class I SAM-dependent rRNA methyltransferase [Dissulfurispiraceae bacterium]
MMEKVFLKRTSRVLAGHLWVFSNELTSSPRMHGPGSIVEVYDSKETFIGKGYINPNSLIAVRLLTRQREEINADFFRKRIADALSYRKRFLPEGVSGRLVYSEGDFLPGLIVDRYAGCLVVQLLTAGMERQRDILLDLLDEMLSPEMIVLKNDNQNRTLEGLALEKTVVRGAAGAALSITEGDICSEVDPMSGQKTGFFLDQRENRLAFSRLVSGGRGLDLFCYSGAWGLHLARKGAHVTFVDSSEAAIKQTKSNAEMNALAGKCAFVKADVFNFLKREVASGNKYDFIVLDPPAFVKSKGKLKEGLRGYREINAMAMSVVSQKGLLATSSCSHHVDKTAFLDMLQHAAKDAGRNVRVLELRSQGRDHPVLLSMPETEYLKCAFLVL